MSKDLEKDLAEMTEFAERRTTQLEEAEAKVTELEKALAEASADKDALAKAEAKIAEQETALAEAEAAKAELEEHRTQLAEAEAALKAAEEAAAKEAEAIAAASAKANKEMIDVVATAIGSNAAGLVPIGTKFKMHYLGVSDVWMKPANAEAAKKLEDLRGKGAVPAS